MGQCTEVSGTGRAAGDLRRDLGDHRVPTCDGCLSGNCRSLITLGTLSEFRDLLSVCALGRVRPVIDTSYPLEAVPDALDRLEAGEQFGKLAITIGNNAGVRCDQESLLRTSIANQKVSFVRLLRSKDGQHLLLRRHRARRAPNRLHSPYRSPDRGRHHRRWPRYCVGPGASLCGDFGRFILEEANNLRDTPSSPT